MNPRPQIGISMNYMQLGKYMQFHVRDKYINALYEHGALPVLVPCIRDKELLRQYLQQVRCLIIIGGNDYPPALYGETPHPETELMEMQRAESDYLLVELCLEMQKPLLGICAGMQLLNIYFGGRLIQHLPNVDMHFGEKEHSVKIEGSRWLKEILGWDSCIVNSNHHQGVNPDYIGQGLKPVAFAPDGGIEAMEYDAPQMVLGIQWHPERMRDLEHRKRMFDYINRL